VQIIVTGITGICDGGVMVSIVAFQAVDPSSILGHRILLLLLNKASRIILSEMKGVY
jgi:hypothetical protein